MPDSSPSSEPKVSVLMITYNHEKYIAQAINSVLMQKTDFPYELIIGEDCSTDGTRNIVREYARKYPEIVHAHLRERNIGAAENSRQNFWASRGNYIALLEGDDYWTSPDKLQLQADLLDAHPETALCGHRTVWHREDGSSQDRTAPDLPAGFYDIERLLHRNFLHTSSAMFRRVIDDIRPDRYRHLPMGDIPLFVEVAHHGNICLLDETMGVYRINTGGSWTNRRGLEKARQIRAMCQAFYDHVDPKYRLAARKGLFNGVYCLGLESFTALQPDLTRQCLRECLKLSGTFEFIPEKLHLAFKGYCWWAFAARRRLRSGGGPSKSRPA